MRCRILLAVVVLGLLNPVRAQAQVEPASTLVERNYLVFDWVVPRVPVGPNGEITTTEADLMKKIREQVSPASWEGAGGRGSMTYSSKQQTLRIVQSEAVHVQIRDLLKTLRGCDVTIEARFLSISRVHLTEIYSRTLPLEDNDGIKSCVLDDVALVRMFRDAQEQATTHMMQVPTLKIVDGQEGKVKIGEWITLGADGKVLTKADAAAQKTVEGVFAGVEGRFLPKISKDRTEIALQLEFAIRNLNTSAVSQRRPRDPKEKQGSAYTELKVSSAVTLPDRHTVALWMGTTIADPRSRPMISKLPGYLLRKLEEPEEMVTLLLVTPRIAAEPVSFRVQPLPNGIRAIAPVREPQVISRILK